jgi:mersacidin/lichenicidin family type 2 lantibiotic
MKNEQIVKAWRSPEFRASLAEQQELVPASPAGEMQLSDGYLDAVTGGVLCRGNAASIDMSTFGPEPSRIPPRPRPKRKTKTKRPGVIDDGDWE